MIVRPPLHWLRMLFVLRGSILLTIAPQLIATTVFAIVVTVLHGAILSWTVSLNFVPFSLIGLTLAIFLGFRNSTSYARYWEARTLWGMLLIETRALTRQSLTLTRAPQETAPLVAKLCAFAHTLRHQLRRTDPRADLQLFLSNADAERIAQSRFPASTALMMCSEWLGDRLRRAEIEPAIVPSFERSIAQLGAALGGCERIANTPIPFTYSVIIHRSIYLYCFWLPFGLLSSIGSMTPVIVCIIAYTFFALEALGAEIEDPIGTAPNDLALHAMSYMIESSLLEMIDEPIRSVKPEAKDFILH